MFCTVLYVYMSHAPAEEEFPILPILMDNKVARK